MDFNKVIEKRASIRHYSPKSLPVEKIVEAIEAANLAPSPGNLQILKYMIVEEPEKIEQIAGAALQPFIKTAPFLVIVCSDSKKVEFMYKERAKRYIQHHAGAAIENFLLKITDSGLASCWVGAFYDKKIKEILEIPENIEVEAILPVGYQEKKDTTKQKPKYSLDGRLFFDTYKNKFKSPPSKLRSY